MLFSSNPYEKPNSQQKQLAHKVSEYFPLFDTKVYGTNLYDYFKYLMFSVHSFVANIFYEGFQWKKGILVGQVSNSEKELLMLTALSCRY